MRLFRAHKGFLCAWLLVSSVQRAHPDVFPEPKLHCCSTQSKNLLTRLWAIWLHPLFPPHDIASQTLWTILESVRVGCGRTETEIAPEPVQNGAIIIGQARRIDSCGLFKSCWPIRKAWNAAFRSLPAAVPRSVYFVPWNILMISPSLLTSYSVWSAWS